VTFTVQSYPNQPFRGTVKQVRLNSTTVNNVVSYTAIVLVANPDGKLLPGMTATAKFVTGSANDVLTVPTAALRFTPSSDAAGAAPAPTGMGRNGAGRRASSQGAVWSVNATGTLVKHTVTTGLSDGQRTQVAAADLAAGTPVVIGANTTGAPATAAASNPLQPTNSRQGGRGGPPGPF
jgi:HlyD family secretion protein